MKHTTSIRRVLFILSVFLLLSVNQGIAQSTWMPEILSENIRDKHFLPDFSYAGYHWGEKPLPELKPTLHVTDYGAVPDDGKDDTEALQKAFAAAHNVEGPVVLKFPPGKFILKEILYIDRSNFVVQGSGSGSRGTVLYCPVPMTDLEPPDCLTELQDYLKTFNKMQNIKDLGVKVPFSLYAWTGGFIWTRVKGKRFKPYMEKYNKEPNILGKIKTGERGEREITVDSADKIKVGDLVSIYWYNKEGEQSTLLDELYDEQPVTIGSRHWENPDYPLFTQQVKISIFQ